MGYEAGRGRSLSSASSLRLRVAAALAGACLFCAGPAANPQPAAAASTPVDAHDDFAASLARARDAVGRRDHATAIPIYERLLRERPQDDDLLIEVARVLGFADRNREAAAMYRRVLEVAPQRRADVRRSLAWQTLWSGEAAAAEALFLESAQEDPEPADAWRGVAESRQQRNDLEGALAAYREALRLDPANTTDARRAAQVLAWLGRHDESIAAFRALLARDPGDRRSRIGLARVLNDAGRHREAVIAFRQAGIEELDADTRFTYARTLRWAGFDDLADAALDGLAHPDAQWLRAWRTARERASWWSAGFDASTDSDDLDIVAARIGLGRHFDGGYALETALRTVRLGGYVFDGDRRVRRHIDGLRWEARASARIGDVDSEWGVLWPSFVLMRNGYGSWERTAPGARLRWLPVDALRIDLEWQRESVEAVEAIEKRVYVDVASIGADWRPSIPWTLAGSLAHLRFDDGNERVRVNGRIERTLLSSPRVRAGIEGLAFGSSDPTGERLGPASSDRRVVSRGYWNPRRYHELRAFASVAYDWRDWQLYGRFGLGTAREVDGWDNRTSGKPHVWELAVARDLSPTLQLRAQLAGSGSGMGVSGGGAGYWRRYTGVVLTGWF